VRRRQDVAGSFIETDHRERLNRVALDELLLNRNRRFRLLAGILEQHFALIASPGESFHHRCQLAGSHSIKLSCSSGVRQRVL
jgi:hypothetical protein